MFFFAKLSETHYKLQRNTCLTYFKKTLQSEPCVSYMRIVLAGQRLLSHRRGSKDHSSLVTAIFRWFRSGDCCDVGLPFVSLSTQALRHLNISVPTSVHAYLCITVRRHRGTASPVSPAVSRRNSRTETKAAPGAGLKSPGSSGELPQRCGAARFVVKLPVLFERKMSFHQGKTH